MASYTQWLRARSDDQLTEILRRRPDLASPSPVTVSSLAARATGRSSLLRATAELDALTLQFLETLAAFGPGDAETLVTLLAGRSAEDIRRINQRISTLESLGLIWQSDNDITLAPGLSELLGPYPAGLAPATSTPSPVADIASLLAEAPPSAHAILEALMWGPPTGHHPPPATRAETAVKWLVAHDLLVSDYDQVTLPREVALVLRGGRPFHAVARPPQPRATPIADDLLTAESTRAATAFVRMTALLLDLWSIPPVALRSGGLGVKELRRAAAHLETDGTTAALIVETIWAAGLITHETTGPAPGFVLTTDADLWLTWDFPRQWALLARAWFSSYRASWLVGTKDDQGNTRTALHPDGRRSWLPRFRARVFGCLAEVGGAVDSSQLVEMLAWATPRAIPSTDVVDAVMQEASVIGLVGASALASAGRAVADPDGDPATALADGLPPAVDEMFLQADLTGVVPGRPSERLARLLDQVAKVESSGGALTVRFSAESVASAIASGAEADRLLAELEEVALGGVPQPLEYLIRDAARAQDRVRVGAAQAYLRSEDEALLSRLVVELAKLGLVRIAPTVLVASVAPIALIDALQAAGVPVRAEGPDGRLVDLATPPRRARPRSGDSHEPPDIADVVRQLRTQNDQESLGSIEPDLVVQLRDAADRHLVVAVDLVAGAGTVQRRRLRPISVDAGRLRAIDPERETEVVVALHRVAMVGPA